MERPEWTTDPVTGELIYHIYVDDKAIDPPSTNTGNYLLYGAIALIAVLLITKRK
jgi:hypothetical protein